MDLELLPARGGKCGFSVGSILAAACLAGLTACAQTSTDRSDAATTTETYSLDAATPSVALSRVGTGEVAVWGIKNSGPSSVFIRTQGDPRFNFEVAPTPEDDAVTLFSGDPLFTYMLGLGVSGTAARVQITQ